MSLKLSSWPISQELDNWIHIDPRGQPYEGLFFCQMPIFGWYSWVWAFRQKAPLESRLGDWIVFSLRPKGQPTFYIHEFIQLNRFGVHWAEAIQFFMRKSSDGPVNRILFFNLCRLSKRIRSIKALRVNLLDRFLHLSLTNRVAKKKKSKIAIDSSRFIESLSICLFCAGRFILVPSAIISSVLFFLFAIIRWMEFTCARCDVVGIVSAVCTHKNQPCIHNAIPKEKQIPHMKQSTICCLLLTLCSV